MGGREESNPKSGVEGKNAAYVIYTSGSSGRPKGVINTHGGIRNRLQWMQDRYGLSDEDCVLQKTSFGFDVSVWEFFWPLMNGSRLAVAVPGGQRDSEYLVREIAEQKVTTVHFVPAMLQSFLREADERKCGSLRRVICSGEALPLDLELSFLGKMKAELHNLYGPTEAAIDVTSWVCQREEEAQGVPIGRPIANTQIYILDEEMQPVPVGVSGELYIGGAGVARGYVKRPELTAEKFVPNPFGREGGERLYRTGDQGKWRGDGNIEFIGRIDDQVKIRGYRIELGEIEGVVSEHEDVEQAVVVAREEKTGEKRLVAYVVGRAGRRIESGELRRHVQKKLPEYMIPSAIVQMEELPLTVNGKVDRRALPEPEQQSVERYVGPRTPVEELLCGIWERVLGLERVGIEDNFFELGGHSLLAAQVISRIQETFEIELPLRSLF
jgi:amino acid adenylation domain-containing protein